MPLGSVRGCKGDTLATSVPGGGTIVWDGVTVGVFVAVLVKVGVWVGVWVGVSVGVLVKVGVWVGVSVGVLVKVGVWVAVLVGVSVGVLVGVSVGVWVGVSVGVGFSTTSITDSLPEILTVSAATQPNSLPINTRYQSPSVVTATTCASVPRSRTPISG